MTQKPAGPYYVTKELDKDIGAYVWEVQGPGLFPSVFFKDSWLAWEMARTRNAAFEQGRLSVKGEK